VQLLLMLSCLLLLRKVICRLLLRKVICQLLLRKVICQLLLLLLLGNIVHPDFQPFHLAVQFRPHRL